METIFVTIASYRDCELRLTLKDAFAKAKHPERLTFGICWQRDEDEYLGTFVTHPQIRLTSFPHKESKGACWARKKTQDLYNGEDFWLQIDSHTRFIQDWDEVLIEEFRKCEDPKALLSTYPKGYKIDFFSGEVTLEEDNNTLKLTCTKIHPDYFILQTSAHVSNLKKPGKSRFIAGGLIFGTGSLIVDVPYDPNYYFLGEEISYAIRAYTHGYNLYYPSRNIVFHHYRGVGDSGPQGQAWKDQKEWGKQHEISQQRFKALVVDRDFSSLGIYGPGSVRTIEDYEAYSGLNFRTRDVHPDAISGKDPDPITVKDPNWVNYIQALQLNLEDVKNFFEPEEIVFWCTAIFDENGRQILRHDIKESTVLTGDCKSIWIQYFSHRRAVELMVWPYYKKGGFRKKVWTKIPESWWRQRIPAGDLEGAYDGDDSMGYWHKTM
jgi:hypothetical protein